jgi:hypothetical protein
MVSDYPIDILKPFLHASGLVSISKTKEQTTIYKTKEKYISDLYLDILSGHPSI